MDYGGVGPERDLASGMSEAEPELLSADGEVARRGNGPGHLDGDSGRACHRQ
jgi:hypothetical protein